jgi:hypothetical protein
MVLLMYSRCGVEWTCRVEERREEAIHVNKPEVVGMRGVAAGWGACERVRMRRVIGWNGVLGIRYPGNLSVIMPDAASSTPRHYFACLT